MVMVSVVIPGYRDLYGETNTTYDELLREFSSNTVLMVLAGLNAELNTNETHSDRQSRLLSRIMVQFDSDQVVQLKKALTRFGVENPGFDGSLFARRYLLSMVLKEVKRNNVIDGKSNTGFNYKFLLAYLTVVDEVNKKDEDYLDNATKHNNELMPALPLIWAANISQYEFNENANSGFEIFKLLSLCKYAYDNYKASLKELINKRGFQNISQYVGSSFQIVKIALTDNPQEFLRRLYFINPKPEVDIRYLKVQSVNPWLGSEIYLSDLKRYPLYETDGRGFMVIDEDFYKKKIYRGALFELHGETSLSKNRFEDYKNDVSTKCFENILFKGMSEQMVKASAVVHYDSNSEVGDPDLYYRDENDIFFIEFKDYLFPDSVSASDSFKKFEKYINERLVLSDKEKPKGVGQLVNNISNLFNFKYQFDPKANELIRTGKALQIHPIICHTDFMFGMPGVNEYLNSIFKKKLIENEIMRIGLNAVTLVSIEVLYDLALRGKDFLYLLSLIRRYYFMVSALREKYQKTADSADFMASTASFDEVYHTVFRNEMIDDNILGNENSVKRMTSIIGIRQEQLNEIL